MVRVPEDVFRGDHRQRLVLALDRADRMYLLAYIASSSPGAFDLAVAALAGRAARGSDPDVAWPPAAPPDPV